ncbi:MAG: hypothetical protein E7C39_06535 [Intestinibacter bartlettii]|uniref:hypothetical protein n=1 Tax=Intestinibacter bartlettii TaxID=261299 RepID=UPI002905545F|nr:hypothetical protein [Intestinibacter bartlettii]MDU2693770.1 hypothetical protein [Intestinibacter bartlettii]
MKYNLQGFSQEVASELNIDGIDLYLLRWFVDFKDTNQMDTKIVDGEVYYWIYHKKVSEDMPILHLQKTAIYRRLKKLCKAQIFKKTVVRERGTFTYYAIGPNYIRLISNTPNSSIANISAIKPPPVSPAFDDDNFSCENCRCSKCCGNFSGCDNDLGYGDHRDCEELATSFNLPTEGFDKISASLMPVEESASNNVGDYILNAGSLNMKSGELKSQESSFESHEGVIESPQGAIESTTSSFKSPQGVINSQEGSLKSPKGMSESLTSPSKLNSHTLNDENLTFEPKTDTFKAEEGTFESDRGALESDQKIEINKNNIIYNSSNSENNETTLSELLWKFIKELNPTFPLPDFKKWVRDFKNILYKDKRDFDEVSEVIEWTFTNDDNTFWSDKIVEASDLRRHYKRILAQFNGAKRALKNKISTSKSYYNTADFIEF